MEPITLTHRDGRTRVATTPAEIIAAQFDGFKGDAPPESVEETAAPAKKTAAKKAAPRK